MATSTDDLLNVFGAANGAAGEARGQAEQAVAAARTLTEEAAAHGWEGVAGTMQGVSASLEAVVGALASAEASGASVASLLHGISDDVSSRDVHERLASSLPELEKGVSALEGAAGGTEEAIAGAETAGEPAGLAAVLHALRETLAGALGQLNDCRQKVEAEVATAGGWGN